MSGIGMAFNAWLSDSILDRMERMAFQVHEAPMMAPAIREPRTVIEDEEIEVDLDLEERPREAAPEQIEPAEPTRAPVEAEACCLRVLD